MGRRSIPLAMFLVVALASLASAQLPAPEAAPADSVSATGPEDMAYAAAHYSEYGRDPFQPLTGKNKRAGAGPRFEDLALTGVFLGHGGNSLVVLEDPTGRGYFTHLGETIGDARLVQILPESALFEVSEYGAVRHEELRLERSEEKR